jgi:hypothetical protein
MAHILENRVCELSTTEGVGAFALTPAIAMQRFGAVMAVGDTCWYVASAVNASTGAPTGEYEYGKATYLGSNSLGRTAPYGSSSGGAAVAFSAGLKQIAMTISAPSFRTNEDWLRALGILTLLEGKQDAGTPSDAAVLALLMSASTFARTETQQLKIGA